MRYVALFLAVQIGVEVVGGQPIAGDYTQLRRNRDPVPKHIPVKSTGRSHSTPYILLIIKNQLLIILT
jgi:hypothetical protein